MGNRVVSAELRAEILKKIESGERVKDVADAYGVKRPTVYSWLKKGAEGNTSLELSRLRRQNKALLELVGQLTYEKELRKKKGYKL